MLITILFLLIMIFFVNIHQGKKSLHMLQQNLYNENNRYGKWLIKNKNQFHNFAAVTVLLSLIGILVLYNIRLVSLICIWMISILLMLQGLKLKREQKIEKSKKGLVVTPRIKRLMVTLIILFVIPLVLLGIYWNDLYKVWSIILTLCIMTYLNPIIVLIAMFINIPEEKYVYFYFKRKAQKKLKLMNHLKVIGITGSYGKTSSKNILKAILNYKYNALATPKNLNTYYGLMMTINNYMDKFTDIFIAEMGAYTKGEIAGLCRFVKPQYGILTTIGTAHLETFGSEQNIIDAKFELIESLPKTGFAILNKDDPKQVSYHLKNKVRVIWIGIDNTDADIVARNIKCSYKGTSFDVKFSGEKETYHFETKLLGKHNVYNILDGIACGKEFGIEIDDLIQAVRTVQPVEHRLELKTIGNFNMIDDAYNSNPTGAKRALEVLDMMPGEKVVVTPGMVELGEKEEEYNKEFGREIASVADYVLLIGENKTKPIKEGLLEKKFDKDKIIVFNDVREAYPYIGELAIHKDVYALFENDLPDMYNEK